MLQQQEQRHPGVGRASTQHNSGTAQGPLVPFSESTLGESGLQQHLQQRRQNWLRRRRLEHADVTALQQLKETFLVQANPGVNQAQAQTDGDIAGLVVRTCDAVLAASLHDTAAAAGPAALPLPARQAATSGTCCAWCWTRHGPQAVI